MTSQLIRDSHRGVPNPSPMNPLQASFAPPNGTVAKLRAASHANCDAARQLPRLKMKSQEANCNWRDAVAHADEGAEAPGQSIGGSAASATSWAALSWRLAMGRHPAPGGECNRH
jgi:hypothetical protein